MRSDPGATKKKRDKKGSSRRHVEDATVENGQIEPRKKAGRVIEGGKNTGVLTAGQKRSRKQKTGRAKNRSESDRAVKRGHRKGRSKEGEGTEPRQLSQGKSGKYTGVLTAGCKGSRKKKRACK